MTDLILFLAAIYLSDKIISIGYKYYQLLRHTYKQRQLNKKLIANHPEMKGISIEDGELLFFSSDLEFKSIIMNNEEDGSNIAIEDDDRFSIAIHDLGHGGMNS